MSQENVDAVRRSLDGWNRADFDAWLGSAHPDIEFRTSGIYPGTDPIYRGRSDLSRFWSAFREPWESLRVRIDQVREVGDEVVSLCTFEGHARDGIARHVRKLEGGSRSRGAVGVADVAGER